MSQGVDVPNYQALAALAIDEAELLRYNPPGQAALTYRVGTYDDFLRRMLDLVPRITIPDGPNQGHRPLLNLNTDAQHDWVVAVFSAWSMVGDVLAFYQERIANEGYLRTATEYRSVMELVNAINYQIRPGAAATTHLVFTVMDARGAPEQVIVPAGTSVQSMPPPGQLPVTFETGEEIEMRTAWNVLTPYVPRLTRPPGLGPGTREVRVRGIRPGLQAGLPLLIVGAAPDGTSPDAVRHVRILQKVETDRADGSTRLIWDEELDGTGPLVDPRVFVMRQRAALFGHDAPLWSDLPTETKETYATRQGGLLRSTDGGANWQPSNQGLPGTSVEVLATDRHGQTFAGTLTGLFRSTDDGQTWDAITTGPAKKDVLCLTVGDDGYLLAGTSSGDIYRTTDAGASWDLLRGGILLDRGGRGWKPVNARLPKTVIRSLASIRASDGGSCLFAGTDRGILRSTDGGNAWLPANRGLPARDSSTGLASVVIHALLMDEGSNVLMTGTDRGVFASRDHGRTWKPMNRGLPNADQSAPSLLERIWLAITGLFHRPSPPSSVTPPPRPIVVYALLVAEDPRDRRRCLLAGTDRGVFVSSNGGTLWSPSSQGMPAIGDPPVGPVTRALSASIDSKTKQARLFAGTDRGVFQSDDLGATWHLTTDGDVQAMAVDATGTILAATPPDGFVETEWPDFRIVGNEIDLDKSYSRVLEGGWVVLRQSQPSPLTGAFAVRDVATLTRGDFSRTGMITRITTVPDAALARFDLRETTVFVGSDPLVLQDIQVPWFEPIQGNTIRLDGAVPDLPPGRAISMTGQRPGARLVADVGGVFQSDTPAWRSTGLVDHAVQSLTIDGTGCLLAGATDGVHRLNGAIWESVGSLGQSVHALTMLDGGGLIAGTSNGVYRLNGTSWSQIGLAGQAIRTLTVDPHGRLCAGTKSGVFRFGATAWEQSGLSGRDVRALLVDADGRLVAATTDGAFVARGTSWLGIGPPDRDARCLASDGQGRLVVGTSDGVFRLAGASWEAVGLAGQVIQTVAVDHQERLYAGVADDGLWAWRAPDATWTPVPIGASNDVRALAVDRLGTIFAGTNNAAIVTSTERSTRSSLARGALFGLASDPTSRTDLDRGVVPTALRTALTDHGITLGASATITVLTKGSCWLLRDDATFLVKDRSGELLVYPSQAFTLSSTPEPVDGQPGLQRWNVLDERGRAGSIVALADDFILDRASPKDTSVGEIGRIQSTTIAASREYTTLMLEDTLDRSYDPFATTISANVAPATHGETVRFEVLGSGDSSKANQRFTLKKPPLTYLAAATASGVESTLSVYVHPAIGRQLIPIPGVPPTVHLADAIQWHEVPSLFGAHARDPVYMIRFDDEGHASIIFGNGERGARLPSGVENVIATYRTGLGPAGNVATDSLATLKSRPPGIRGVANPVPATGGAPPDSADLARERAPITTRTFGRIVSLQDYEDFVRTFAGVSKARVRMLENGVDRLIQVTLAGENGTGIDVRSSQYAALVEAVERYRVPGLRVRLDSYDPVLFSLEAAVLIDPDHLADAVLTSIEQTLTETYGFDRREFGQNVTASDVVTLIQGVVGVRAIRLGALYRAAGRRELATVVKAEPARWEAGKVEPAQIVLLNVPGGIQLKVDQMKVDQTR